MTRNASFLLLIAASSVVLVLPPAPGRESPRERLVPVPFLVAPSPADFSPVRLVAKRSGDIDRARFERLLNLPPPPSAATAYATQTMGADQLNIELEAGDEVATAGVNQEPGAEDPDGRDDPRDAAGEDPFAGIGEGSESEPLDEFAALTPEERTAAALRALQSPDDPRDAAPDDDLPPEPADEATDEPFSVLSYIENTAPPSVLRYTEDVPPATRLPAYDLQDPATDASSQEAIEEKAAAPPILAPGIYVHPVHPDGSEIKPGDPTLGEVVLGQPFMISVAVPVSEVDRNGDGAVDDLTIRFATEDGEAELTLAHDPLQDTRGGVFVYRTANPVTLAGKSQGLKIEGSVTGLELDSYEGARTVTIRAGEQSFRAIDVYTNVTQRGIGMIGEGLDMVSNVLVGEIAVIRRLRSDPQAIADPKVVAELDDWQTRVDRRLGVIQRARALLADPDQLPIVKVEVGQFYLERLFAFDEDGRMAVADDIVPFQVVADASQYTDFVRMDDYARVRENVIRDELKRNVIDYVLPAYLLGMYDQFNSWNVPGAVAWSVGGALTGEATDHFGREKSFTHLAFEVGMFVIMVKLPDVIVDWAAGGFGAGRLPSIGIPRFRGGAVRGGAVVRGPGRLARETLNGKLAYPGSATRPIRALPQAEREWWQGLVASRTPAGRYDEALAVATRELDELDIVIRNAQRLGLPFSEIESALAFGRSQRFFGNDPVQSLRNAVSGVRREVVIRAAVAEGRTIVVHPNEMQEFRAFADVPTATVRQEDLLMIAGIKARAEFEARHGGKPMYSPDEVEYARQLLEHGDGLKNWLEFHENEGGLRFLFDDAAIADLRTVFGGAGPPAERIAVGRGFGRFESRQQGQGPANQGPADPFTSRGDTPDVPPGGQAGRPPTQELSPGEMEQAILNAETVRLGRPGGREMRAEDARPLATLEEYRALVARQAAGEALDLGQIARPGIAKVLDGRVLVQQGSGRWENTRPDDWLDLFVDARAPLPDGAVVVQRGVSPEIVRQANLLSSRGQAGTNPGFVDIAIGDVPEFVRIRVRGRDVQAPLSKVGHEVDEELTRLAADGADLTALRTAMEPLSPNERLALLRNDAARAQALQTGAAPAPPPTAGIARLSELDQRVIQKAFRTGRGEAVEWTPDELIRLQQIAYPASGVRPSALHRRLMPVAEQLGGEMRTIRADANDFRAVLDQADEMFLAFQEMEDLVALAGEVGVPADRIQVLTAGLGEGSPPTVLERASRGLLREIDQAKGIIQESGIPDDFFVVTRMYFAGRANGGRLLDADAIWVRERIQADPEWIQNLARREFEDLAGEPHTILDPAAADQLQRMYRTATEPPASPAPSPATVDPTTSGGSAMLGGPSGQGGAGAPVEVVVLSTEGSTGPVMEALFVNVGGPVRVQAQGIVLEPVTDPDPATLERVRQIRQAALEGKPVPPAPGGGEAGPMPDPRVRGSVVRVALDAYCLQADQGVPTRGTLFRIAAPAAQSAHESLRPILEASRRLYEQGALEADDDPEGYFHSIRQWALWADEKDMDAEAFADAFVAHAERNLRAAGQEWNAEVAAIVRDYAPGRWADVEAVLRLAGVR